MTSSYPNPSQPSQPPVVSDTSLALTVYVLYIVGYFTGITAIVGVIIAYIQGESADPFLQSHYRFQIRTFWIGFLYLVVGTILSFVIIGIAVLFWWFIWSL